MTDVGCTEAALCYANRAKVNKWQCSALAATHQLATRLSKRYPSELPSLQFCTTSHNAINKVWEFLLSAMKQQHEDEPECPLLNSQRCCVERFNVTEEGDKMIIGSRVDSMCENLIFLHKSQIMECLGLPQNTLHEVSCHKKWYTIIHMAALSWSQLKINAELRNYT